MKNGELVPELWVYDDQRVTDFIMNVPRWRAEYWVDRGGRIRRYKGDLTESIVSFHYEIAARKWPYLVYPGDRAFREGWVMIGSTVYHAPVAHRLPNARQLDTLVELGMENRLIIKRDMKLL